MSTTGRDDDLDRIDGGSFIAWLIYAGAGTMIGSVPMSFYYGFIEAFSEPPQPVYGADDFLSLMSSEMMQALTPLIYATAFAGAVGALVVFAARSGIRLHTLILLALGALAGPAAAWLLFPSDVLGLVIGAVTGLVAGGGMALARRMLIRGG